MTCLAWESFGEGWVTDAAKQLKLEAESSRADYGHCPISPQSTGQTTCVFTWNGTTSGVRVPDGDWIADDRTGLSFCRRDLAVFA